MRLAADLAGTVDATPAFRRWNRRLYNPLCVTLAILVDITGHESQAVRSQCGDDAEHEASGNCRRRRKHASIGMSPEGGWSDR